MSERQRPDRGPARRPGRGTGAKGRRTPLVRTTPGAASGVPAAPSRPRSRLTGRSAILVLLLAVLAVSYASSAKAYLNQRGHIADLKAEIAARSASIESLQTEQRRWRDPAFLERQARERFQFVMPGETSYQTLTPDGQPLGSEDRLHDPATVVRKVPTAWYDTAWQSMEIAGETAGR